MIRGAFILVTLGLLAACANKPSYMNEQQPQHTPLSQRKITVTAYTNGPVSAPVFNEPVAYPSQPQAPANVQPVAPRQVADTNPPPRVRVLPMSSRIASVNEKLRFVIVDFTNSRQPSIDERLGVYRVGEKVAEIKISGPYRNTTVAADIVAGEVKYGDEVKPQ